MEDIIMQAHLEKQRSLFDRVMRWSRREILYWQLKYAQYQIKIGKGKVLNSLEDLM